MTAAIDAKHRAEQEAKFAWVSQIAKSFGNPEISFEHRSSRERNVWCTADFISLANAQAMEAHLTKANFSTRIQERIMPGGHARLFFQLCMAI